MCETLPRPYLGKSACSIGLLEWVQQGRGGARYGGQRSRDLNRLSEGGDGRHSPELVGSAAYQRAGRGTTAVHLGSMRGGGVRPRNRESEERSRFRVGRAGPRLACSASAEGKACPPPEHSQKLGPGQGSFPPRRACSRMQ